MRVELTKNRLHINLVVNCFILIEKSKIKSTKKINQK